MTTAALRDSSTYSPVTSGPAPTRRIASIDIVRGLVVVLMAIDHVRVYAGVPAGGPTYGVFFTRWITHFVAPAFVFLAGTAAFLYGQRVGDRKALSRFLVTRGLWLVLLELTVIRAAWTFNFDYAHYMLGGVIWMIGWCMVLMAAVIHLPMKAIAIGSLAVIIGHNATAAIPRFGDVVSATSVGKILYGGGSIPGDDGPFFILFVLVPWIAVMAAGYAFGPVMQMTPERRRSICLRIGIGATVAFVLLRGLDVYGDPNHWRQRASLLSFLATAKYPASLLFLLMTLGPTLILLALVENARGPVASKLETFGKVPFFYYLLHIPVIHVAAIVVSVVREGTVNPWLFTNFPLAPGPQPDGYRWSLSLLYLVWAIVIVVLYFACRWYARVKAASKSPLLSYL